MSCHHPHNPHQHHQWFITCNTVWSQLPPQWPHVKLVISGRSIGRSIGHQLGSICAVVNIVLAKMISILLMSNWLGRRVNGLLPRKQCSNTQVNRSKARKLKALSIMNKIWGGRWFSCWTGWSMSVIQLIKPMQLVHLYLLQTVQRTC